MNINSNRLMNSKYKDKIAYFINNTDLNAYFPNCKIVKFAELDNYASIYELLPNKLDFAFILVEEEKNTGHWQLLLRNQDEFSFFDSYGDKPTTILNFIPKYMNRLLGNDYDRDMGHILKSVKKGDKLIINKFPFQSNLDGVNTCGRWCIARTNLFMANGVDNAQFVKYIKREQKNTKLTLDELVCALIAI
jgi:hypothetical protein